MTHIEPFDTVEEGLLIQSVFEDIANLDLIPGQVALRDDVETTRYWAQPIPEQDEVVYGETPPVAEMREPGFDVDSNRAHGYLTGVSWSGYSESPDHHDVHVSQVVPISRETFEVARGLGWPNWSRLTHDLDCRPLGRALAQHEAEARA